MHHNAVQCNPFVSFYFIANHPFFVIFFDSCCATILQPLFPFDANTNLTKHASLLEECLRWSTFAKPPTFF